MPYSHGFMDTDVLRWFKLVAEGVTVTEVSELEMVTQSGVSRALARLEAQVGTPLLERSGRTLRLTRTGEVFKPYVDRLLDELRGGLDAVAQFVSPETGTVAVAFQQSLGSWLVPDLLGSFRAAHPGVGFRLTQRARRTARAAARWRRGRPGDRHPPLQDGRRGDPPRRPRRTDPADRERAAPPRPPGRPPARPPSPGDRRFRAGPGIRLAEVAREPFIALRATSALRKLGDDLCAAAGFRPKVVFEGDDLSNVRGLVTAGLGVAIVPAPRAGSPWPAPAPCSTCRSSTTGPTATST